jgi:hypothetical protein
MMTRMSYKLNKISCPVTLLGQTIIIGEFLSDRQKDGNIFAKGCG